jgi:NADPH:quinone reductase-like Zn-dependent oxidoreductase
MRAAIVKGPGLDPEYGVFPDPQIEDGFEAVELVAAGLHPIVRSLASGRHYGSTGTWPLIPGVDAVARTASGDIVLTGFVQAPYGTFAERMAVPKGMRIALPAGADPVKIAAGLNPGLSSWLPLKARAAEVPALDTVLILGVTGMAGLLATQHARILGATNVIGVGRNPASLKRAEQLGATSVPLTGDRDVDAAALLHALDGASPTIVLDYLWGSAAQAAFAALARNGLDEDSADIAYVQIGAMAGPDASLPASLLRSRHIRVSGSGAGSASVAEIMKQIPVYMQFITDGKVDVPTKTFPLSAVAQAWATSPTESRRAVMVPSV